MKKLLKIITKSINLVHLGINFRKRIIDKSLTNYWNEIAINCKQIKSLRIELNINKESLEIKDELFSIFKGLKRLDLSVIHRNMTEQPFRQIQDLKHLKGLTHFSLRLYPYHKTFDETLLSDIDINLPKLRSLKIWSRFTASEWTVEVLSKLTNLETIALRISNSEIKPQIEKQLILNCRKFKRFNEIQEFY